jgi:hypothetical protein
VELNRHAKIAVAVVAFLLFSFLVPSVYVRIPHTIDCAPNDLCANNGKLGGYGSISFWLFRVGGMYITLRNGSSHYSLDCYSNLNC